VKQLKIKLTLICIKTILNH